MSGRRRRVAPEDRRGWAYHAITVGVAILAAAIVILCAAGAGLLLAQRSEGAVPGRGVTPIPTPVWVQPS